MPAALNLKLDVLDASTIDTLRGPGSSSSEQIPSTSPDLYSPFPSSLDSYRHPEQAGTFAVVDALKDDSADSELDEAEQEEQDLHVIVIGGDVGAFATSLALAKSDGIRVTLVNIGIGSFSALGNGNTIRGSMLNARTISYLDELGKWEGSGRRGLRHDAPFEMDGRSSRWKGKGSAMEPANIGERIREEGVHLNTFAFQRYLDGEQLVTQEYIISTGEDVSMTTIDTDTLLTILRDACLSHPRIDVRPRGIVRAVLPGAPVPSAIQARASQDKDTEFFNSTALNKLNSKDKAPSNAGSATFNSKRTGVGKRPGAFDRHRQQRRKARESFIQFDDDEHDDDSPTTLSSLLSPIASTPLSSTDASLGELLSSLPSRTRGRDLFSTDDLPGDALLTGAKLDRTLDDELRLLRPAVVLTSGERLEADAILGTEGPQSKVLDVVLSARGNAQGAQVLRENGIFRANIAISRLLEDLELSVLVGGKQRSVARLVTWPGPGRFLTICPLNRDLLHVVLTVKGGRPREDVVDEDEGVMLARQMKGELSGWCNTVTKLLALVESATYESVFDYSQLEQWVSNSGRVAVLGDAAHPLLPLAHQALSSTIDDALTLGAVFRKPLVHPDYFSLRAPHLVPRLLNAFVSLRRPLCLRTQLTLREGRDLFSLPDGERQQVRDTTLRESGLLAEEEKRAEWLFDPLELVEKWWDDEFGGLGRRLNEKENQN